MALHCLILTSEFPPLAIGGAGRYVSEVAARLAPSMRVTVALIPTYRRLGDRAVCAAGKARQYAVAVIDSDYGEALSRVDATLDFGLVGRLASDAGRRCAAYAAPGDELVVYVQDYALSPVAADLGARFPRALIVAACHLPVFAGFTYFDKPIGDAIHQVLEAQLVHLARHIVVPSTFAAQVLRLTHNVAASKLAVNALGAARPAPALPLPPGPPRLLAVGRATEQKGYHFLFEALRQWRAADEAIGLTVVAGDGDQCARLTALATHLDVASHVRFMPQLDHDAIWRLYDEHHMLVTTSLYETFGLAVLEAMASARPTIGFAVGALPELWGPSLRGELGTPVARLPPLVERVGRLAGHGDELADLSGRVERRAQAFSWERHVGRLLELMGAASADGSPWR